MKSLHKLLDHPEFKIILFLLCCALFGWPFISATGPDSPEKLYRYLYTVWALIIILLFFIGRSYGRSNRSDSGTDRGED